MILDNEPPPDVMLTDQQHEMLENAAEMLYGLIHARYLVTARGLSAMMEKFKNCDFGRCPRCARLVAFCVHAGPHVFAAVTLLVLLGHCNALALHL